MKLKVGLPVLLLLLISLLFTDRFSCTDGQVCEMSGILSEISQDDHSYDRYTDYNRPLVFPSESSFSFFRTSAGSGVSSANSCARRTLNYNTDKIMIKDGKLLKTSDLSRILINILLFPSGHESMDHHLIILRKLII